MSAKVVWAMPIQTVRVIQKKTNHGEHPKGFRLSQGRLNDGFNAKHCCARRGAFRYSGMSVLEQHAAFGETVDVRCMDVSRVGSETTDPVVHVIDGNEQDIRPCVCCRVAGEW